jgi:hypothetical protein
MIGSAECHSEIAQNRAVTHTKLRGVDYHFGKSLADRPLLASTGRRGVDC